MDYKVIRNIPDHMDKQDKMIEGIWPQFMLHDPVAWKHWHKLFEYFDNCQFSLESDGVFIGIANSIPIRFSGNIEDLPEEGWD